MNVENVQTMIFFFFRILSLFKAFFYFVCKIVSLFFLYGIVINLLWLKNLSKLFPQLYVRPLKKYTGQSNANVNAKLDVLSLGIFS